jgi:hypothetical protein
VPRLLPRSTREIERLLARFEFRFDHHGKEDIWVRDADRRVSPSLAIAQVARYR